MALEGSVGRTLDQLVILSVTSEGEFADQSVGVLWMDGWDVLAVHAL